jgi:hypothetical protein
MGVAKTTSDPGIPSLAGVKGISMQGQSHALKGVHLHLDDIEPHRPWGKSGALVEEEVPGGGHDPPLLSDSNGFNRGHPGQPSCAHLHEA